MLTRAADYDPARGPLSPWLLGIARNFVRRRIGCDARFVSDDAPEPSAPALEVATPEETVASQREIARLHAAIAALPPHYRDVLVLVELAERSYVDTARPTRDTMGRTRQERKDGRILYLYDPMENRSVVIDTETVARIPRVPAPPMPPEPPMPAAPPTPPTPPTPTSMADGPGQVAVSPGRVVVRRAGSDGGSDEVKVEVVRVGRGDHTHPVSPMPPMPPITLPLVPRGKGETKSLGTREFEGLKAEGTLTTHTIPAGAIGNERSRSSWRPSGGSRRTSSSSSMRRRPIRAQARPLTGSPTSSAPSRRPISSRFRPT